MAFDVTPFFKGYFQQLRIEAQYFSGEVAHPGEKGRLNEGHLVQLLRRYLPQRFGVGTGFVASTNPDVSISPQCDIIIYDAINNAPLYSSDAFSIFPIEMVYAVVEVKTTLDADELRSSFDKCIIIRSMAATTLPPERFAELKASRPDDFWYEDAKQRVCCLGYEKAGKPTWGCVPPRFLIFAYNGWANPDSLNENLKRLESTHPAAHVHGICVLDENGGYYARHLAWRKGDEKIELVARTDGFTHVLLALPGLLDTLLPADRSGIGFDMVNVARYRIKRL